MTDAVNRLNGAIGLAMKAGKLASGEFAAEKAMKSGGRLVIVDSMASENTKKQWTDACKFRNIPLLTVDSLGCAIGKPARMVAVATDENFSKMILSAAERIGAQNVEHNGGNDR